MNRTVLCVDSDPTRREETEEIVHAAVPDGVRVLGLDGLDALAEHLGTDSLDCLITEYRLDDGTGIEAAALVRERAPDAGCVLYTAADYDPADTPEQQDTVVEFVPRDGSDGAATLGHMTADLLRLRSHTAYPVGPDEDARVAAVARYRAVLDDVSERLERLKDIARWYFGTSVVFIGLIDADEQQYVVHDGLPADSLPRQETVCTYTLQDDGVTVIEDLQTDPLFAANETLRGEGFHAYAGARMVDSEGHIIGTVCVMDHEPRSFDEKDRAFLSTLADEAMATLETQRRLTTVEAW